MPAEQAQSARERILETAGRLFYQYGYHAVGVDTIIAEARVAKMTLYRHFASKDDLVVAYLERVNTQLLQLMDEAAAGTKDAVEQIRAIGALVAKIATSPQCLGCVFQMSASEFPANDHPAHRMALAHKTALRDRLATYAYRGGLHNPEQLADQLMLLIDGAWIAARMFGPQNPAASLSTAIDTLLNSALSAAVTTIPQPTSAPDMAQG